MGTNVISVFFLCKSSFYQTIVCVNLVDLRTNLYNITVINNINKITYIRDTYDDLLINKTLISKNFTISDKLSKF